MFHKDLPCCAFISLIVIAYPWRVCYNKFHSPNNILQTGDWFG
ncbi:hypothetical protein HMPREF0372_01756 [Flavonifractor plautii ATCC 29863]|uniref:Uncharacterized protein n=1 Tax=Flavonifractor plautii ATCC 29863 TaxID=411475 RepID=G9YQG4_FLAPL|nr:hypothetical protein HMPREF0372_01756 [Flavonifractor plautii ATCC 29863]